MTPLLSSYTKSDDEGRFAHMMDKERAVVEWRHVHSTDKKKISFQVIITFATGDIHFVYRDVYDQKQKLSIMVPFDSQLVSTDTSSRMPCPTPKESASQTPT